MKRTPLLALAALTCFAASSALAQTPTPKPAQAGITEASAKPAEPRMILLLSKPSYPLHSCVACDKALTDQAIDYVKDGHLFRIDAEPCKALIDASVAPMWKKVEDAVVAQQKPTYPLKTSAVSGKPLTATPTVHVYGTRLVLLLDPAEVATFQADPAVAMKNLDKAYIDAQLPTYTLTKCPVSQEPLSADAVNYLYGTKLVRLCCSKCKSGFDKTPETYLKAMTAAR